MSNINIAIIPARGGSKRIHKKNIRNFIGKPMISYAIEAAKSSQLFDSIVVTTDSSEIADISINLGADKVINRPDNLADDFTPTVPVIAHAINELQISAKSEEYNVCCIYPTNPFLEITTLKQGLLLLLDNRGINYTLPVSDFGYPIQRSVKYSPDNHRISMFNPEYALTRSQDLEMAYHDVGQWYWGKAKTWLNEEKLLDNCMGVLVPRWKSQDIDNEEDWIRAEMLYRIINERG